MNAEEIENYCYQITDKYDRWVEIRENRSLTQLFQDTQEWSNIIEKVIAMRKKCPEDNLLTVERAGALLMAYGFGYNVQLYYSLKQQLIIVEMAKISKNKKEKS